ncbi:MAG: hypothetical protein IJO85_09235 [Lachnospiraceae bacterium]|nr:hypothetical protein [Lachnospiraceae bacterium]
MTSKLLEVDNMLNSLDEEDYQMVIRFIEFLSTNKKKKQQEKNEVLLGQIQEMFKNDKGWVSEESMLDEMASFRKERLGL